MAGILANSASATMLSGDTSADNARSGYITSERVVLTTTPTGTDYVWAIAAPNSSSIARSALSAETGSSVTFTPDVAGYFTVTCTVDSTTTYVLRLSVTATAVSQLVECIRFSPKTNASIPTPAAGVIVFFSSDSGVLSKKDTTGTVTAL